jgi:hypothetical protein
MAHQEWLNTSERYQRMQRTLREAGSVVGRAPYGFRIVKQDGVKALVPVPVEAKVIQDVAAWYLAGDTLDVIAERLNVTHRLPRKMGNGKQALWSAKTLSQMLHNEAVAGRRRNGEGWTVKPDAILTRSTWESVIARLAQRATRAGISQTKTPAMLTSIIKCGIHNRNAYRTGSGYYCRVKGCKTWIALDKADRFVHDAMSSLDVRDMIEVVTPGGSHDDAIAEVKRDMQDAIQAEDFERLNLLKRELDRLRSLPATPATVTRRESAQTVADMWKALPDDTARRSFLLERKARVVVEYAQDGKSRRLVFDGPWIVQGV